MDECDVDAKFLDDVAADEQRLQALKLEADNSLLAAVFDCDIAL